MNTRVLRAKCIEKEITLDQLASSLEIGKSTLYRRLKNKTLTIKNMNMIREILGLTEKEVISIFFENEVA